MEGGHVISLLAVFALAFAVRLYAVLHSAIINLDGVIYIQLARAFYYGQFHASSSAHLLGYFPPNPILIAGIYGLVHNWIIAARTVSLFFGLATLFPIYFIAKRLFSPLTSLFVLLIYSLNPVLVSRSADAFKGPISWFFLALALYWFMDQEEKKGASARLFASSLCFAVASWARVEYSAFYLFTAAYLLLSAGDWRSRGKKLLVFSMPLLLALFFALWGERHGVSFFRTGELLDKIRVSLATSGNGYEEVRRQLSEIWRRTPAGPFHWFLPEARNNVWLIALGALLNRGLEAFFYPFVPFFLVGIFHYRRIWRDYFMRYLGLLSFLGIFVLYREMMMEWIVEYRYFAMVIIPAVVFAGFGVDSILFLLKKRNFRKNTATVLIMVVIVSFGLVKNVKPRYQNKAVYKEIGRMIAGRSSNKNEANLVAALTPSPMQRWVTFYANPHLQAAPYPQQLFDLSGDIPGGLSKIIGKLKKRGVHYFLLDEASWPGKIDEGSLRRANPAYTLLGSWRQQDVGKIFLLYLN